MNVRVGKYPRDLRVKVKAKVKIKVRVRVKREVSAKINQEMKVLVLV